MKKIISALVLSLFLISQSYALTEWRNGTSENSILGTELGADIDSASYNNIVAPLDRLLANYRQGCNVIYASASSVTVETGAVTCSDGTVKKFRQNTSNTTVTWANIDAGGEAASTTYYVYAVADADASTFTVKISTSSTSPSGVTYYKRLGSFYNNSSSNIDSNYIFNDANTFDGSVNTLKLKTAIGEISATGGGTQNLTLTGGEYGFYPQIKAATGGDTAWISFGGSLGNLNGVASTSYTTNINIVTGATGTIYVQQRYVTSSGKDYWIFLLIDKSKKKILASYNAADHPAYGNGGDFTKTPHPFTQYINDPLPNNLEIVLVEKLNAKEFLDSVNADRGIAQTIAEDYFPDMKRLESYSPMHSGRFIDKEPELVNEIPSYVTIRKLKKLTDTEKQERNKTLAEEKQIAIEKNNEEVLIKEEIRKQAIDKLKTEGKTLKYN